MADPDRRQLISSGAALLGLALLPRTAAAVQSCSVKDGTRWCRARLSASMRAQRTQRQNRDKWCWAAALSMIFGYYGHPISQEQVVTQVWGKVVNVPRHVDSVMRDINRNWVDDRGRRFKASGMRLTLDPIELPKRAAEALERNRPLIVGTLGHATVLTEMHWSVDAYGRLFVSHLIVSDPAEGSLRDLTFEERWFTDFVAVVDIKST